MGEREKRSSKIRREKRKEKKKMRPRNAFRFPRRRGFFRLFWATDCPKEGPFGWSEYHLPPINEGKCGELDHSPIFCFFRVFFSDFFFVFFFVFIFVFFLRPSR